MAASPLSTVLLATILLSGCAGTPPVRVSAFQDAFTPHPPVHYTLQAPLLVPDAARGQITQALQEAGLQPAAAGQRADVLMSLGLATREQSVGVTAACAANGAASAPAAGEGTSSSAGDGDACAMPGQSQPWFGAKRYRHVFTLTLTDTGSGAMRYRVSANRIDQDPDGAAALPVLLACALHPFPRDTSGKQITLTCDSSH
jgi:hypothetical protein